MRKLKLYLDTSVWNFYYADDAPKEKEVTLRLFEDIREGLYEIYISEVVTREILESGEVKAQKLVELIKDIKPRELIFA